MCSKSTFRNFVAALAAIGLLAACDVQSGVQSRYVSKQSDCRSEAEDKIDAMNTSSMSEKQRNAALVDKFSTCMIKAGWHVARPVKNPVVPTPPGTTKNPREAALPAQPLPGQPSNVITTAAPAPAPGHMVPGQMAPQHYHTVPAQSSAPNMPVKTQSSILQPAPGQPALSAPAVNSAPATYQRHYVPPAPNEPLPGRQF